MTLQQIRYFVTVGRTLNYTQASRELFVSQSAVSKQIQGLEQELQLQLFRRDHHSVALTPAGEFLYQKFREILVQMEDALEQDVYKRQPECSGLPSALRYGAAGLSAAPAPSRLSLIHI